MAKKKSYRQVVLDAMRDLMKRGTSKTSVAQCMASLREAFPAADELSDNTRAILTRAYESSKTKSATAYLKAKKQRDDAAIHDGGEPEMPVFTRRDIDKRARELLDQKIKYSVDLIVLRREQEMNNSLARFLGWATSLGDDGPKTVLKARKERVGHKAVIKKGKLVVVPVYDMKIHRVPVNGTSGVGQVQTELFPELAKIVKPSQKIQYEQRRVTNDQGHKLSADIAEAVAESQRAIGYEWHHHFSKNPRGDHEALDGVILLYKSSWAAEQGLIKPLPGTTWAESLGTKPAREINCRCTASFIYTLRNLYRRDPRYLTKKGLAMLGEKT